MKTQLKVLRTDADYERAMDRLSALMAANAAPHSDEDEELEVLRLLIASFEEKKCKYEPVTAIEAIKFRMEQMELKPKDLIPFIGSLPRVSEVLAGRRPLSISMMKRLRKGLGIPASALIDDPDIEIEQEQPDYDYSKFPLLEMMDRGCFPEVPKAALKKDPKKFVAPFLKGVSNQSPPLLRAPLHQSGSRTMDEYALIVWRACVARKAAAIKLKAKYEPGVITSAWLRDVAKLSAFEKGPCLAQEFLGNSGIRLVFERRFNKTYLDGAAMLDGTQPIVALTLRHDRLDNFWFALLHELVHVDKHLNKSELFIADNLDDKTRSGKTEEDEADKGATEALIPRKLWEKSAVRTTFEADDAILLAKEAGVHPAIVAGRVRHETGDWRLLSGLIRDAGPITPFFANQLH